MILAGMHSIQTPHFLIARGRVRPLVPQAISNELADHIAAELVPLGLVPDGSAFERVFVDAVLSTQPDPERAVHAADGGWLVLDRDPARSARPPLP